VTVNLHLGDNIVLLIACHGILDVLAVTVSSSSRRRRRRDGGGGGGSSSVRGGTHHLLVHG